MSVATPEPPGLSTHVVCIGETPPALTTKDAAWKAHLDREQNAAQVAATQRELEGLRTSAAGVQSQIEEMLNRAETAKSAAAAAMLRGQAAVLEVRHERAAVRISHIEQQLRRLRTGVVR